MEHTDGKWEVKIWEYADKPKSKVMVVNKEHAIAECIESYYPKQGDNYAREKAEANARLIAEAGTVANETGLTPKQLAEQIKDLEALVLQTRPAAECYHRVCESLSIQGDILGYVSTLKEQKADLLEACEKALENSHNPVVERILQTAIAKAKVP